MLKRILFNSLVVSTFFIIFSTYIANAATITINSVTDDSYVSEESTNANYGNNVNLIVQSRHTGKNYYSFITFDLSSIPSGATIDSATLNLYAISAAASRTYESRRASSSWSESTITWSSQPGVTGTAVTTTTATGWMSWNVLTDVQAFYGGSTTNYGWRIKDSVDDAGGAGQTSTFYSSESTATEKSYLSVTYTVPATCGISATNINFGATLVPGDTISDISSTVSMPTGNTPTTSLTVKGTDWTGTPSGTMLVGQTSWKTTGSYLALTTSESASIGTVTPTTPLIVNFQLAVPNGQAAADYTQTITFTASC